MTHPDKAVTKAGLREALANLINKWACMHDMEIKHTYWGGMYQYYLLVCTKCGKVKTVYQ